MKKDKTKEFSADHIKYLGGRTPLERREHPEFGKWFEKLWKELNE